MHQQNGTDVTAATSERPWRASLLLHRQVVNARTVESIGSVSDLVFDPQTCRLVAIALDVPETDASVSTVARRFLSGYRPPFYVGMEHIVALNDDVVIIDIDTAHPAPPQSMQRLPHLNRVLNHQLVTLHGMRLGRLADLLLDYRGGQVVGYLINPTRRGAAVTVTPPTPAAEAPADDAGSDSERAPTLSGPLPANLRIVPASPRVRVGRELILVLEDVEPVTREDVVVRRQAARPANGIAHEHDERADELVWRVASVPDTDPDAPTQELHP